MRVGQLTMLFWSLFLATNRGVVNAESINEIFESARLAANSGNNEEAERLYSQLLEQGVRNEGLLVSRGDARAALDKIGPAIADYVEALALRPGDSTVLSKLRALRENVRSKYENGQSIYLSSFFTALVYSIGRWGVDLALLFTVCVASGFVMIGGDRKKSSILFWTAVASVGTFLFGTLAAGRNGDFGISFSRGKAIIVISDDTRAYAAPTEGAQVIYVHQEGEELWSKLSAPNWTQVDLPGGRVGWVKESEVHEVVDSEPLFSRWMTALTS